MKQLKTHFLQGLKNLPGAPWLIFIILIMLGYSMPTLADDDIEVEGFIQSIGSDSLSDSLMVNSIVFYVDEDTEIKGPDGPIYFSDLQVGQYVEVEAELQVNGVYLAKEIELEEEDGEIEVEGTIQSIGTDSLVVEQITFFVDSNTVVHGHHDDDSLSFSDLQVGDRVEVHAVLQGNGTYLATRIELEDEDDSDTEVKGRIQHIDNDTLTVNGLNFRVNADTEIRGPHHSALTLSDLLVGDSVEVHAQVLPDSSLLATRIELEEEDPDTSFEGRITALAPHTITVDSISAIVNATTRIRDLDDNDIPFSELQVGDSVQIHIAIRPDSSLLATHITVREFAIGLPTGIETETVSKQFKLGQNYPNPFNPGTTIPVTISAEQWQKVELAVFNILGQRVKTLFNGLLNQGSYTFQWNGRDERDTTVPSGIYFYQLRIDRQVVETRRMLLVK